MPSQRESIARCSRRALPSIAQIAWLKRKITSIAVEVTTRWLGYHTGVDTGVTTLMQAGFSPPIRINNRVST